MIIIKAPPIIAGVTNAKTTRNGTMPQRICQPRSDPRFTIEMKIARMRLCPLIIQRRQISTTIPVSLDQREESTGGISFAGRVLHLGYRSCIVISRMP